jgi:hypothetical protein
MRVSSILATAFAASVAVACGGDGPAAPEDPEALRSPVGEFTLATVNGENVPMLWDQMDLAGGGTLKAYWNGGSIQFRADSSFTLSYRHTLTGPRLRAQSRRTNTKARGASHREPGSSCEGIAGA